jgi:RNA polymerase sigma-70 factor (ECF subfamily)
VHPSTAHSDAGDARCPAFVTTHWSVVLTAGRNDTDRARNALAKLCQTYWFPIYAFVRRKGFSPHDAQDLTQEFFARLLEHNWLAVADPARGRFRSFLLGMLTHFLANEWRRNHAQKRGGGALFVPLDTAETRYGNLPAVNVTPEQHFERRWAVTLLGVVLQRLGAEFERENKPEMFALLKPCLVGDRDSQPYAVLARKLGTSEGAVKVTVHRLRKRYRQLLRDEVAQTVATPDEVEAEVQHLIAVLADG